MKQTTPTNIKVISIQVTPPKRNSKQKGIINIVQHIKHQFTIEAVIGINRLYLFNSRRIIQWMCYIISAILTSITIYINLQHNTADSTSYTFIKHTNSIEYIFLMIFAIFTGRGNLRRFFNDLSAFDVALNLSNDLHVTCPNLRFWFWGALGFFNSCIELILIVVYVPEFIDASFLWTYVSIMAHDCEQLLFGTLLRMIMLRANILKAYVVKTFSANSDGEKKLNELEALSNKAQLDISSLHRNYELLHKCAELLNSVMNLPMTLMLFCSGLSTTMLLKNLYREIQVTDGDINEARTIIIYCIIRCFKYTTLVIAPCYFSSLTTTQVSHIRTILHDAMNGAKTSKLERRRVKAFFQLTRENEFSYALWGVIKLNMSLPLSYLSLCTTYLVIIIQFSKFID